MSERAFRLPRMAKGPPPLSQTAAWAAAAAGAAYFGVFLKVSHELLLDGSRGVAALSLDRMAAAWASGIRQPWLTHAAVEVTSLGSPTALGVIVAFAAVGMYTTRDRLGAILLAAATAGAMGWTSLLKNLIERERPPLAARLVITSGYSFPSGHSLASASILGALALTLCRHLPSRKLQVSALAATVVIISAVAASRVYLGVHYLTDVAAGTSFGLAWILAWAAVLRALEHRRTGTRV